MSISPNSGSVGGSVITANLQGVGPLSNTTDAYFAVNGGTLVDNSTQANICEKVWIESYGVVKCKTLPGVYIASTLVAGKSYSSGEVLECLGGTTSATCLYE